MRFLDLDRLAATPLACEPFDHVIVPGFVGAEALGALAAAYPAIEEPGSFPLESVKGGPAFDALIAELRAPATADAFGTAFGLDLRPFPTMVTVRGRCQAKDGRIHTDTATKIITVLIYLNGPWQADGGRLRLLRGPDDLDDMAAEVPPDDGTMLAFRRSDRSFHGHKPFVGPRRVVQLNWVTDARVVAHEQARHRWSARAKRLGRLLRPARAS
jgi:hypothetical protein